MIISKKRNAVPVLWYTARMDKIRKVAVVLDSSHEISRKMIQGIIAWSRCHAHWDLSIVSGGPGDLRLPEMKFWHGDGIIARLPTPRIAAEIAAARLPTVLIDPNHEYCAPESPLARFSSVACDSAAVGRLAADFYLKLGYRSFAFAAAKPELDWSIDRARAFRAAVETAGGACAFLPANRLDAEREQPRLVAWLRALPPRTALFAANDHRARDILRAAAIGGIRIPEELAVLGVNDDALVCESTFPRLSSVRMDAHRAGYVAAEILAHHLAHPRAARRAGRFRPLEIVERESAGLPASDDALVLAALKIIHADAARGLRAGDIAARLHVTLRTLELHLSAAHISVKQELARRRLASAERMVRTTHAPLAEIARQHGYAGTAHFTTAYKKAFGTTPAAARRAASDESGKGGKGDR